MKIYGEVVVNEFLISSLHGDHAPVFLVESRASLKLVRKRKSLAAAGN
jgi:hypothetical protein